MKRIGILLIAVLLTTSVNVLAQGKLKFGHIDSQQLIQLMPEREAANKAFDEYQKELESAVVEMNKELQDKYNKYLETKDSLSAFMKTSKEEEIQALQERIQNFQVTAQQDLQTKESELLQPIIDKARKAIEDVGAEKGYTYVFDISVGVVLYHSKDSEDILPFVKAKLGIL